MGRVQAGPLVALGLPSKTLAVEAARQVFLGLPGYRTHHLGRMRHPAAGNPLNGDCYSHCHGTWNHGAQTTRTYPGNPSALGTDGQIQSPGNPFNES